MLRKEFLLKLIFQKLFGLVTKQLEVLGIGVTAGSVGCWGCRWGDVGCWGYRWRVLGIGDAGGGVGGSLAQSWGPCSRH